MEYQQDDNSLRSVCETLVSLLKLNGTERGMKCIYAVTLWASAYKSDLHKLNVLNNRAVRCTTFANRHTNLNTKNKNIKY